MRWLASVLVLGGLAVWGFFAVVRSGTASAVLRQYETECRDSAPKNELGVVEDYWNDWCQCTAAALRQSGKVPKKMPSAQEFRALLVLEAPRCIEQRTVSACVVATRRSPGSVEDAKAYCDCVVTSARLQVSVEELMTPTPRLAQVFDDSKEICIARAAKAGKR